MDNIFGVVNINTKQNYYGPTLHLKKSLTHLINTFYEDSVIYLGSKSEFIKPEREIESNTKYFKNDEYVVALVGEITNTVTLLELLRIKGHSFIATSDTEVILKAYKEWGNHFVNKLEGSFVVVIYHLLSSTLHVFRDAIGSVSIYYYQDKTHFIFSTELKTILQFGIKNAQLDYNTFYQSLLLMWSLDNHTGFVSIKKINAGHYILFTKHKLNIYRWYTPNSNNTLNFKNEKEWIDELDRMLNHEIKNLLNRKHKIGFFLSGGIDSSLLLSIALNQNPTSAPPCFCMNPSDSYIKEGFGNDLQYAKLLANKWNLPFHVVDAKPQLIKQLDRIVFSNEEPQVDFVPICLEQLILAASGYNFDSLISGMGGDDIFSGYRRHRALVYEDLILKTPNFLKKIIHQSSLLYPLNTNGRRIRKFTSTLLQPHHERMFQYFNWAPKELVQDLFLKQELTRLDFSLVGKYFSSYLNEIPTEKDFLNQMLYLEQKTFLPNHNLNYAFKLSLKHHIDIQSPYLSKRIIDYSWQVPPNVKMKHGNVKYILKKVSEKYLPKEIIERPKTGFGVPIREWMTNNKMFQTEIKERIFSGTISSIGIFDMSKVEQLFEKTIHKNVDASYQLLALAFMESWVRQFSELAE